MLPDGGQLKEEDLAPLVDKLKQATYRAKHEGEIYRSAEANIRWHEVYPELSEGKPGIFGAVTARAEAQVMRLATIYALLDSDYRIEPKHLAAALEVWRYCEASARHIFGSGQGNATADRILESLKENPEGLSRNGIYDLFQRNVTREDLERALKNLSDAGLATCTKKSSGRGRPVERWELALH